MSLWTIVLLAAVAVLLLKLAGYLVPESFLEKPTPARMANLLTVALLAALIGTQTFATGQSVGIDARLPAVLLAAVLFALRVPFIVVLIAAAGCAAVLRMIWPGF